MNSDKQVRVKGGYASRGRVTENMGDTEEIRQERTGNSIVKDKPTYCVQEHAI